ncbi:MAG: polysaccharide export protein [Desulfobulbaceae bacterium]|nr:polysaccharide export protein [Desulfobulbaceae bacterium]
MNLSHKITLSYRALGVAFLTFLAVMFASIALAADYSIGYNDVIRISVYDHPDMETKVRVNGNGEILVPLLGHVNVDGLTIPQTTDTLTKLLADGYIINPQVNIFIEEYGSKKAVILGQVLQPGLYELSGQTTLLELISKAGGLKDDAGANAHIRRKGPKGEKDIIAINLRRLMEGGDISQNITINHKDNVFVSKAGMFYVAGEVKNPDAYKIEKDTTVIKAITKARGFTGKASKGKIRIIRITDGKETILERVSLDTPVQADDVVVVPESFF